MKVIDKTTRGKVFSSLNRGDCFIYDNEYYMKCDRDNLALNLEFGVLCEFNPLEKIEPFNATLTAE